MTKTANKKAIRNLPALRASVIWFKRETVRNLRSRAESMSSPRLRAALYDKASKVSKTELADLRDAYIVERVSQICAARLAELSAAIPGLVRL
jgi:hypothetical protein